MVDLNFMRKMQTLNATDHLNSSQNEEDEEEKKELKKPPEA